MSRMDWQWPAALVFIAVFAIVGSLVYLGKLQSEALLALLAWLVPAPWMQKSAGS